MSDRAPGLRRRRAGGGFMYLDRSNRVVRRKEVLARIRALAIPPAWTDVWICTHSAGHLQAVGRDARGRKQYRYHPLWRAMRDRTKYDRMLDFAAALPKIRGRVRRDLRLPGLPREKVLATVVRLLELTRIRVGNVEYSRTNDSYGLTTLRNRHVRVRGSELRFRFRGKGGKAHEIAVAHPRVARIVRRCLEIPGQELFQYVDEGGEIRVVASQDVNDYLREISGGDFTAKDFRTWAGTTLLCKSLRTCEPAATKAQAKKNLLRSIAEVAKELGNTPAVCRKAYIHPAVSDGYLEARALDAVTNTGRRRSLNGDERFLLSLLRRQRRGRRDIDASSH